MDNQNDEFHIGKAALIIYPASKHDMFGVKLRYNKNGLGLKNKKDRIIGRWLKTFRHKSKTSKKLQKN